MKFTNLLIANISILFLLYQKDDSYLILLDNYCKIVTKKLKF